MPRARTSSCEAFNQIGKTRDPRSPCASGGAIHLRQRCQRALFNRKFKVYDFLDLGEEPRINAVSPNTSSTLMPTPNASATYQSRSGVGFDNCSLILSASTDFRLKPSTPTSRPAQRLLQRFLEGAADRHHFADALHLRGQVRIGF